MTMRMRALLVLVWMTLVTGIAYPLLITGVASFIAPFRSGGSIILSEGKPVGSHLIGQKFTDPKYFWGRPSASDYDALKSGGSQLGPTSLELKKLVEKRVESFTTDGGEKHALVVASDLVYASGSGLDPHISLRGAYIQVARIVSARNLGDNGESKVIALIDSIAENRKFGFLGQQRVNVLELNLSLDKLQVDK